ncbi:hypothetical protein PC117_g21938 [Phytophthora cactorum]|uniref:Uncharacterized protein n=1 Tax=Phytophthora cactorum TaxID=29920 RepID=A0A8T1BFL5_9STRA|nr:hypothetical protein PC117_g21938 [Phytophthora cactorum]
MDDNAKSKTDDPPTEEEDDAVNGGPQTTQCAPGFYRGGSPTSGATEQNPVNHEEFTVGFVAKEKTNAEDSDPGPASVFPYSTASHSSDIRPDQLTQPTPQQILEDSQALTVSKDPDPGVEYVKTVGSRYAWLRWIVMSNLPLSFCESELTRQYTSLPAVAEAAKLRAKTPLLPVLRQETWWSSTFATVDRYVRLREFLSADDGEIADLLLPRSTHRSLQTLLEEMKDIESISKKLQSDGLTLLLARELFGGLLELKPSFASYLASNAEIVDSPAFDSGAVKTQVG